MSKFRKKPVVIEAVQLTQEVVDAYLFDMEPLPDGLTLCWSITYPPDRKVHSFRAGVATLEGFMQAEIGDWIITGVAGEKYPCKPDIFAATYDPVQDGLFAEDIA